jgi:hypothetical protein
MNNCGKERQKKKKIQWIRQIVRNLLKPTGYFMYQQVKHSEILNGDYIAFMCFAWLSEQTVNFASYSINWLVFITEAESV